MKELRLNMLAGKKSKGCSYCYELEEVGGAPTFRQLTNTNFSQHYDYVETTNKDGSLEKVKMNYLDIRFNNLCNLKCQTCCHEFSSSWHEDRLKLEPSYSSPKVIQVDSDKGLWNELYPLLKTTEQAYFAGGEPLICDQHYKVLDYWLEIGRDDVAIMYQTNFALLSHNKFKVLDYWKKFKFVTVLASIDDCGPRAEYLRKGTDWPLIEKNRQQLKEQCPEVKIFLRYRIMKEPLNP
jgi:sulfatase maturation enzyme AslB (radical SAM superfamily)